MSLEAEDQFLFLNASCAMANSAEYINVCMVDNGRSLHIEGFT